MRRWEFFLVGLVKLIRGNSISIWRTLAWNAERVHKSAVKEGK